ncbi:hypothetical protein JTB14_002650 [Gonioctena quinquepunctata]|nr:hypothetical protein JTB14_002650 [Gonioctena quinquepunctata]
MIRQVCTINTLYKPYTFVEILRDIGLFQLLENMCFEWFTASTEPKTRNESHHRAGMNIPVLETPRRCTQYVEKRKPNNQRMETSQTKTNAKKRTRSPTNESPPETTKSNFAICEGSDPNKLRDHRQSEKKLRPDVHVGSTTTDVKRTHQQTPKYDEYTRTILKELAELEENARGFEKRITQFIDIEESQEHYFIEESLIRIVLELDKLEVDHDENLRAERKSVIKYVYHLFDKLKRRAQSNKTPHD